MNQEYEVAPSAVRSLLLASACVIATVVVTLAGPTLVAGIGVAGTVVLLAILWIIAIIEVVMWLRLSSARSLGLSPFKGIDIVIGIGAGIVLMLLVPVLAVGSDVLFGAQTGTVETAAQLNVFLAAAGVLTAAVTEEVVYRAGAMSALLAARAPKWLALLLPALIFAAMHWSWGPAHMAFVALPLGIGLGALFLWRRSLLVNVIAHAIIDIPVIIIAASGTA